MSPVRTATVGRRWTSPRAAASFATPASGTRRFRSTSTASALSGETYRTVSRSRFAGSGENMSWSMQERNAASVLPLPVGARRSVLSPRRMGGQPSACAGVGAAKERANQVRVAGWKPSSESGSARALTPWI